MSVRPLLPLWEKVASSRIRRGSSRRRRRR